MRRRKFIGTLTALAVSPHISTTDPLVYSFTQGRPVQPGRIELEIPPLAENNPVRDMAVFYLGAHCPRAEVSSRIRLNSSQRVVAIAELSDGSFWSDAAYVEVREAACTDGG